jgi:hypothetical protein
MIGYLGYLGDVGAALERGDPAELQKFYENLTPAVPKDRDPVRGQGAAGRQSRRAPLP